MAYIKEYLVKENGSSDSYLSTLNVQYSSFEDQSGQVNFKVCEKPSYVGKYLFQSLADSRDSLDDLGLVMQYESISTLVIMANQGPIIINGNTFEENIGTMGGVMHIMSADFETNANRANETVNSLPYIYIESNTFARNMAYLAGNAIYMAHTVK